MTWLGIFLWILIHIPDFVAIFESIINLLKGFPLAKWNVVRISISDAIHTGDKEHVKTTLTMCRATLQSEYDAMQAA